MSQRETVDESEGKVWGNKIHLSFCDRLFLNIQSYYLFYKQIKYKQMPAHAFINTQTLDNLVHKQRTVTT